MKASIHAAGSVIELETRVLGTTGDMCDVVTREVCNLKDQAVREALCKLGWTPPGEHRRKRPVVLLDSGDTVRAWEAD